MHVDDRPRVVGGDGASGVLVKSDCNVDVGCRHRFFDKRVVVGGPYFAQGKQANQSVAAGLPHRSLRQLSEDVILYGLASIGRFVNDVLSDQRQDDARGRCSPHGSGPGSAPQPGSPAP